MKLFQQVSASPTLQQGAARITGGSSASTSAASSLSLASSPSVATATVTSGIAMASSLATAASSQRLGPSIMIPVSEPHVTFGDIFEIDSDRGLALMVDLLPGTYVDDQRLGVLSTEGDFTYQLRFFIDITEVTNKQFKSFVDSTGYITIAERDIDWELLKSQLSKTKNLAEGKIIEGKITKINLTNQSNEDYTNVNMFDQTTLFSLNANSSNARHSFFQMDVAIGADRGEFWLFGGTGNFSSIGQVKVRMDNILYGVKDAHYPYFKHLNNETIPRESAGGFIEAAHRGANAAMNIDDANDCTPVTGEDTDNCPITAQFAWRIHLDTIDLIPPRETTDDGVPRTNHRFRKVSAAPTVFKGNVYFPIYEPPVDDECGIGNAFICVTDDECGTNNSHLLQKGARPEGTKCNFVREGILSELVIFGDTLFANVAGPKEDEDTLYKVLAAAGEVQSNRGSWRESGF